MQGDITVPLTLVKIQTANNNQTIDQNFDRIHTWNEPTNEVYLPMNTEQNEQWLATSKGRSRSKLATKKKRKKRVIQSFI